jgi:hypothetical protein
VALACAIAATLAVWLVWWPLALVFGASLAAPIVAPVLARHVLVRAGAVRASYYVANAIHARDSAAYALCVAAWAHAHAPTSAGEAWLRAKRDKRKPLGDAEVVATALLAAARDDADTARALMRSSLDLAENHPAVRELAGEWLACDAADRGAWRELADEAVAARWPATPLAYLLEGVAMRRTGVPGAPGALELRARWLLAPHRRATRSLLAHVAAPAPTPTPSHEATTEVDAIAAPRGEPMARAIASHIAFAGGARTSSELALAVDAWNDALSDDETRIWLGRRAIELGAQLGAADRALREVTASIVDELARLADRAALPVARRRGPVADALAHRLRHGRLDALEAAFARWGQRRHEHSVPAIDEWRDWIALRAAYDAASTAGGLELRRLAFQHAYAVASAMSAWLWNTRREYALSHAISEWLLAESLAVGDTEAIELCTRNCNMSVPTRLGDVKRR